MATCVLIIAIVAVLITNVAIIISFATPNWVTFEGNSTAFCDCTECDCGLWLYCKGGFFEDGSTDNCYWFFSNNFELEQKLPDWFKTTQGLMSCAMATSFISLIVALFSLCCHCKNCNPHHVTASFVGLTFLLVAASVCVFGVKSHLEHDLNIFQSEDLATPRPVISWSFWVAAGAAGMAFVSSIFYCCVGDSRDEYV